MTLRFETLPLSTNNLYAHVGRRRFLTERARRNKDTIAWEARSQYRGKPLAGPLAVRIDLYWPDRRKHDVDNVKGLLDALTGIVWEDDGQILDLRITKAYSKSNPGVLMQIDPITP